MGKRHKKHKSDKKIDVLEGEEDGSRLPQDASEMIEESAEGEKPIEKMEKPLKLVLKVGLQDTSDTFTSSIGEERPKHKHKKKKKKKDSRDKDIEVEISHRRSHQDVDMGADDSSIMLDDERPHKKICVESDSHISAPVEVVEERPHRSCTKYTDDGAILRQCLEYLQKILQNKDVNGFFAYPVTDAIAPGYSSIILNPMDFSTMQLKLERNEYRSIMEYKKDFVLMCNNAMTYNRPETVYYKEAKRLLHIGLKQLSKEKLLSLKKTHSFLANLTLAEIGIDENGKVLEDMPTLSEELRIKDKSKSKSTKTVLSPFEPFPDNLSPEEILAQAQAAAKEAKEELALRRPKTDLAFLRQNKKGVTTLNIINPENEGIVSETERVVNLGEVVGKLATGSGCVNSFKEDRRNKVSPLVYLNYGPFSSFAPQYDSSFANITKEESDLLLATYGDETGVQYARSVQSFVSTAGDYAVRMVNNLLDLLTKGQHTRTNIMLEQQRRQEEQRLAEEGDAGSEAAGIGSCLDSTNTTQHHDQQQTEVPLEDSTSPVMEDPVQKRLLATASLISDLHQAQELRLSQPPPPHLAHCPPPSPQEMELAAQVTQGLTDLAKDVAPGDLVSVQSLRSAMGIAGHSLASPTSHDDHGENDLPGEDSLEHLDNLPSTGTAPASVSESVSASQATEEEEDEDDDDDDDMGEDEGGMGDDDEEDEEMADDTANLNEFFPSPTMMDGQTIEDS
ncbi:bromodomain-containing protein 7-like isoform X2 [Pomacea canaliculata]|uniref:bromodomain-containing protein 7-like isoform X2 n=1 Tax=Pomacea canaliculata TaxID=400727 RepID=UPI000D736FD1|nr:bromodomain-containing protein 7-like isoform X2 [Pomacea canaliculata]